MDPIDAHPATADWYRTFAERDTAGASPVYTDWAHGVAQDAEVLRLLDTLPPPRRQPNLVFGAVRFLGATETGYAELRPWLIERWPEVAAVVAHRRTQTNEAGRCAALLPELARLEGPLALLEVGASAGLCLFPDRYSYDYRAPAGAVRLDPVDGPSDVVLPCRLTPADRVPRRLPEVVWRAGIDLNPLDVTSPDDVAWLSALVRPGQPERLVRRGGGHRPGCHLDQQRRSHRRAVRGGGPAILGCDREQVRSRGGRGAAGPDGPARRSLRGARLKGRPDVQGVAERPAKARVDLRHRRCQERALRREALDRVPEPVGCRRRGARSGRRPGVRSGDRSEG